jgi:hypothetical protein
MNNLKLFEQWVSQNEGLSSSISVDKLNRYLNDPKFVNPIMKSFNSLGGRYKKILFDFAKKETLDLPKITRIIKKFNLIERLKSKKGDLNDKIDQVTSDVNSTNEEFFIEAFFIFICVVVTALLLGGGITLIIINNDDGFLIGIGIFLICLWILLSGVFYEINKQSFSNSKEKEKTEIVTKNTDNMAIDSDTTIVKQVKTDDGKLINLVIIKKGNTYLVEEVK